MYAVVVNVTVNDFEGARKMLEEEVVPRVKQAPGFVAGYWTRTEDNRGLSMIVVETEEGARAVAEMIQRGPPDPDVVTLGEVDVREVVASA